MNPGPCNRCGAHKENVLGLCGACGRFPKPKTERARKMAYPGGKTLHLLSAKTRWFPSAK